MRRVVVSLVAVLLPLSASAAPVRQLEIAPKEVILGWINQYRHNPEPDRVPLAVRGMSRLGLLSDTEGAGVYVGFLAGIVAKNPDLADGLIASAAGVRTAGVVLALPALAAGLAVAALSYSRGRLPGVARPTAGRPPGAPEP